ncbi:MAG: PulJ/GspJ family protein [Pirellulaceae bacterium]
MLRSQARAQHEIERAPYRKSPHVRRADRGLSRSGYTLLELLIVGMLVSVLMVGVWSLFRTWSGLYERGERQVLRMQLVRSLCDQFTDDVHAATQVIAPRPWQGPSASTPPTPGGSPETSGGGNMALMGESDWLMLEVVQSPNPWQAATEERGDTATDVRSEGATLAAPELRLVLYTFAPPESEALESLSLAVEEMAAADDTEMVGGEAEEETPFAGLLRVAVAQEYLTAWSAAAENRVEAGGSSSAPREAIFWVRDEVIGGGTSNDELGSVSGSAFGSAQAADADSDLQASILERDDVAEVEWFEFRYFDGASWQSSWNSLSQGRLPVAIEMRFELKIEDPVAKKDLSTGDDDTELVEMREPLTRENAAGEADRLSATSTLDDTAALDQGEDVATPYYRCVVFLQPRNNK